MIATGFEGLSGFTLRTQDRIFGVMDEPPVTLANQTALTAQDRAIARRAWDYIENNTIQATGLVNSVANIKSTTLWDQGSYIFGLIAAKKIGLIDLPEFEQRSERLLDSLRRLPLFEGALPNKVYRTDSLRMTTYDDTLAPDGIGWSALDVARLLLALAALEQNAPELRPLIRRALSDWKLNALTHQGELIGTTRTADTTRFLQEGRIGYEQYAARAAALWGLDVSQAISANRIVAWHQIEGIQVATDSRTPDRFGAINPALSEPYFLQGLELGFDSEGEKLASQIYLAQVARYASTGLLTAVTEDHIDQPPYFLYSSVYSNGAAWAVVAEDGQIYPRLRTLSSKAAIAWDVLYATDYTSQLRAKIETFPDTGQGWPAGFYEVSETINAAYTLNTNAIILEALHYKAFGPFWSLP